MLSCCSAKQALEFADPGQIIFCTLAKATPHTQGMDPKGDSQALPDFSLQQDMLKLYAMVWQQQASKAVRISLCIPVHITRLHAPCACIRCYTPATCLLQVVEALPEVIDGHGCDGTAVQEALLQVLYSCVCLVGSRAEVQ